MMFIDPKTLRMESDLNKDRDLEPLNAPKKAKQEKLKNMAAVTQSLQEIRGPYDGRDGSKPTRKDKRDESRSRMKMNIKSQTGTPKVFGTTKKVSRGCYAIWRSLLD
ncbi:hypothetical protein RHMOL_Rhmol07G0183700 [Rhododendron molle]|uniref:Uncharacterized protein n=1 Tax=Rhododendron molle TaxID=49168 RepID=A0ACC0N217_RHOML|nr:hypothetical protein RHMOL_Rhmol07G0183700 [Rhododendron molle]